MIAVLLDTGMRGRMADFSLFVDLVVGDGAGDGDDHRELVEWLSAVTGDEVYTDATERLGWPHERYVKWMTRTVRSAIEASASRS